MFIALDGVVEMPEQGRLILPYFDDEVVELIQSEQEEADTRVALECSRFGDRCLPQRRDLKGGEAG